MRIIDFHTHLADRWFETPLIGEADFVAGLNRCGVQMACVFTLMGFYEDAARHNDHLASRARANPGRMIPFATVDPKRGLAAVRELDRCLCDPLFRGVKFHPWLQAFAPSMVKPVMLDILKLAADRGVPVLFHDGTPPYSTTFQIAEVARWNEHANVVLGHAGLADYTLAAGVLGARIDNLYLCACCPHAGDIAYLVDAVGADKVLFGSDFGIADWRMLAERLDDVLFAGLDDVALDKVLYTNAARLLRLPG